MVGSKLIFTIVVAYLLRISSSLQYFHGYESNGNSMGFHNVPGAAYWAEKLRVPESSQSAESCEVRNNTVYATMEKESSSNSASNESPEFKCIADILNSNRTDNSYSCQRPEHPQMGRAEIIVHRPAPIIVRRPPTKVIIRHPPLVVKPSPVVFHRPPPKILRPVFTNTHPQHIRVEPILVQVKKPLRKVFVKSSSYRNEHFTKK